MQFGKNKKKMTALIGLSLFVITGSYNAFVINAQSHLKYDNKFFKRIDEVLGVTIPGREIATVSRWEKLTTKNMLHIKTPVIIQKAFAEVSAAPVVEIEEVVASVQEDLTLELIEVVNPKKWQQPLTSSQFSGSLKANSGIIESLEVVLPVGDGLSISFSEMTGNVFEYEHKGEAYSGMIYQVDQNSYMVSLTNGPLEGTRLRFSSGSTVEQVAELENAEQYLAEKHNVEIGTFGEAPTQRLDVENAPVVDATTRQAQAFNFGQPTL